MGSRFFLALSLCLLTMSAKASGRPDAELQRITSTVQDAKTQTDMNLASKKLADYWEAKLVAVQTKIESKLDAKERKEFAQSNKRWQSFRTGEVAFRARLYEGGSMQPLIANNAYSEITEHRVSELQSLLSEGLAGRAEPTGATNRSQPIRSETNRTSAAAGSGR